MQVLVDLDFFPQEIGLDGSIAVELIRVINSSLRKMFYSQRRIPYVLWEMAVAMYTLYQIPLIHLYVACGKRIWVGGGLFMALIYICIDCYKL